MNLLIITGFLGSGKTTFLRSIANEFTQRYPGKKMAIIENEVGKVGIDGQFLNENGLLVREINSGCICCSLRIDFITTLLELERDYSPELVILEPSGVAGPMQVVQSLYGYGGEIASKRVVSIIDASRIQNIPDITIPIIVDGINVSDFTVINKVDLVNQDELSNIRDKILKIRPNVCIIETSALNGINVDIVVDMIFDDKYQQQKTLDADIEKSGSGTVKNNAVVFAKDFDIEFGDKLSHKAIGQKVADAVHRIASELKNAGCSLIGHLKAVVKADNHGCIFVSTTSFELMPHIKGSLLDGASKGRLIVNAIVYDVDRGRLEEIVCEEFRTVLC